jgi:hypothetical protein
MLAEVPLIILVFLIGILLVLYFFWMIIPMISGLPWIPTRPARIYHALALAHISPGDILYDLGSGDGRVLVMAAREFGARAIGIEIRWASFYKANFKDADVIFISVSFPNVRCSQSKSPQDWRNSVRRSRDGGVLSIPNVSGSPATLVPTRA